MSPPHVRMPGVPMSEQKVVSLVQAAAAIRDAHGQDAVVALDDAQSWVFDPQTGEIRRADGKFYAVRMVSAGAYAAPLVYEEPQKAVGADGIREVGQVVIEVAPDGMVRTRALTWPDGTRDIELLPSSLSKGEVLPGAGTNHFCANPKRIQGEIGVHVVRVCEKEGDGWMTPREFVRQSRDGRSLAALAKANLI